MNDNRRLFGRKGTGRGAHFATALAASVLFASGAGSVAGGSIAASPTADPGATTAAASSGWQPLSATGYPEPSDQQRENSIRRYTAKDPVRSLQTTEQQASETVINLSSDILFDFDKADLPPSASAYIAGLLSPIPQGATLAVYGHTDSVGSDEYNLDLSKRRASAVAAVIASQRPDLVLDTQGFGESRLKVPETGDVAEARRINRRVELRYQG